MCRAVTCRKCGKITWAGCGQHVKQVIGVTFLMNGGPATVYGARAFAAFQEFYAGHAAQPAGQRAAAS